MIRLRGVGLERGGRALFDGLDWHVRPAERIGLVGRNGAGKTTLLRILTGEIEPDRGEVLRRNDIRIGNLAQDFSYSSSRPLLEVVLDGAGELRELERRLERQRESLGELEPDSREHERALAALGRLEQQFAEGGGFAQEARARRVLAGLGFEDGELERPLDEFSGGWQMRAALAGLLLQEPDLLLLDEPTNHLDLDTVEWLERYLRGFAGTLIVVSHDRVFLDRIVRSIAALRPSGLRVHTGGYSAYREAEAREREELRARKERQDRELARTERFVERFRAKNTKASQVQSRVRMLEKIERVEIEEEEGTIGFRFPPCVRAGDRVVVAEDLAKSYDDLEVFRDIGFEIRRGERVALVGPNGAGKSTLMRILAGFETPSAGTCRFGANVEVASYTQEFERQLDPAHTLLQELRAMERGLGDTELRRTLGAFRFSGDDAEKPVGVLSGGEKSRLAIAKLLLAEANFLILDEPTNHLDLDSKRILQDALLAYEGTLLVVSHDRAFLDGVVGRVLELRAGVLRDRAGSYSEFLESRERARRETGGDGEAPESATGTTNRARTKEERKRATEERMRRRKLLRQHERAVEREETELATIEQRLAELAEEMARPEVHADPTQLEQKGREAAELQRRQEETLARWEAAQEALDRQREELGD